MPLNFLNSADFLWRREISAFFLRQFSQFFHALLGRVTRHVLHLIIDGSVWAGAKEYWI